MCAPSCPTPGQGEEVAGEVPGHPGQAGGAAAQPGARHVRLLDGLLLLLHQLLLLHAALQDSHTHLLVLEGTHYTGTNPGETLSSGGR